MSTEKVYELALAQIELRIVNLCKDVARSNSISEGELQVLTQMLTEHNAVKNYLDYMQTHSFEPYSEK